MRPTIEVFSPLQMQWEDPQRQALEDAGFTVKWSKRPLAVHLSRTEPDLRVFMWCDNATLEFLKEYRGATKNIVYIRRYEHFTFPLEKVPWDKVSEIVVLNDFFAAWVKDRIGREPVVLHNGVDPSRWTYAQHGHGNKIAMVGFVNARKNFPLAMQIMAQLDRGKELHVAGDIHDGEVFNYLTAFGRSLGIDGTFYGEVDDIDGWLEDKNYLLCTSISEGWPNNVIEAMAKGIKPIIHAWPGSDPLNEHIFYTVHDAVGMMGPESEYLSRNYREHVCQRFGRGQFKAFADLCMKEVSIGESTATDRAPAYEAYPG